MEAHNKLVASVGTQVLNHHALCGAVGEKSFKLQPLIIQSNYQSLKATHHSQMMFLSCSVLDLLLHLEVADDGGVVGAHGCTTDCVANSLSGGESGTAPAQGHCGRVAGRDAHVIRRRRGGCQLVSGR